MTEHQQLQGLIAATFTPMDVSHNIHLQAIDKYAEHILASGVSGVFVCGTTGEFTSLTTVERMAVLEKWIQLLKEKMNVIAHVGSDSQIQAMELTTHAVDYGADAIAAIAPSFFKPTSIEALIDFFVPIAKCAKTKPFYYYHMPSMTGINISVSRFLEKGREKIPNLAGVKYTHNNLMEIADCINMANGTFEVLHGYDEMLICGLVLGAKAAVGSTYNYASTIYMKLIEAMQRGDIIAARKAQMESIEIVKIIIKHGGGVRGGKAIMNLIGIDCGPCRAPLNLFTEEEYVLLKKELNDIKFL